MTDLDEFRRRLAADLEQRRLRSERRRAVRRAFAEARAHGKARHHADRLTVQEGQTPMPRRTHTRTTRERPTPPSLTRKPRPTLLRCGCRLIDNEPVWYCRDHWNA